jgi:hypothetical protein
MRTVFMSLPFILSLMKKRIKKNQVLSSSLADKSGDSQILHFCFYHTPKAFLEIEAYGEESL